MAPENQSTFQLPLTVIDKTDISRALRELDALENFMRQSAAREPGTQPKLPRTSRTLDELARLNKYNLLIEEQRQAVKLQLTNIANSAPEVHVSFAVDPSAAFTGKIVTWFRKQVHPYMLVQVGLQPSIAAGCVVRTPNKYFDLSLRKHFSEHRRLLTDRIKELL